jgi:hypothetical protein
MNPSQQNEPLTIATVENARLLLTVGGKPDQVLSRWQTRNQSGVAAGRRTSRKCFGGSSPFKMPGIHGWVWRPRRPQSCGHLDAERLPVSDRRNGWARSTWLEILGQSLSAMARSIGSFLGREVACAAGGERSPGPGLEDWASASLSFGESSLAPLSMAFSPEFLSILSAGPSAAAESHDSHAAPEGEPGQADRQAVPRPWTS